MRTGFRTISLAASTCRDFINKRVTARSFGNEKSTPARGSIWSMISPKMKVLGIRDYAKQRDAKKRTLPSVTPRPWV